MVFLCVYNITNY